LPGLCQHTNHRLRGRAHWRNLASRRGTSTCSTESAVQFTALGDTDQTPLNNGDMDIFQG
jgi:hypothetical protein